MSSRTVSIWCQGSGCGKWRYLCEHNNIADIKRCDRMTDPPLSVQMAPKNGGLMVNFIEKMDQLLNVRMAIKNGLSTASLIDQMVLLLNMWMVIRMLTMNAYRLDGPAS